METGNASSSFEYTSGSTYASGDGEGEVETRIWFSGGGVLPSIAFAARAVSTEELRTGCPFLVMS